VRWTDTAGATCASGSVPPDSTRTFSPRSFVTRRKYADASTLLGAMRADEKNGRRLTALSGFGDRCGAVPGSPGAVPTPMPSINTALPTTATR
jgi:hypothetical protein